MRRRKFKLNAAYGREAQDILAAFETCAAKVRYVKKCSECLHCKECQKALKPVSTLGAYVAYIEIKALPSLKRALSLICLRAFKLTSKKPNAKEIKAGACWALSLRIHTHVKRIPLFNEPNEHLLSKCLAAYAELSKKYFDRGEKDNESTTED